MKKRKKKTQDCQHEWIKSFEECVIFDDAVAEHTGLRPKWTCKKCGKVSYTKPI